METEPEADRAARSDNRGKGHTLNYLFMLAVQSGEQLRRPDPEER